MPKYIIGVLALALIATALSVAGVQPMPPIVPQALFAVVMILVLLNLVGQDDGKRL